MNQYRTDNLKTMPNKELHITPDLEGFIEHYGKVLTIETLPTDEIQDVPQVKHFLNNYHGTINNLWIKFCYIESPTISKEELEKTNLYYLPKNVYLARTTLLG